MIKKVFKFLFYSAVIAALGFAIGRGWTLTEKYNCYKYQGYEAEYTGFELNQEDINYCYTKFGIRVKE